VIKSRGTALPSKVPTKSAVRHDLKTAKAVGLKIPQSLLARADHVIE
jgi:hypothetical protein